MYTRIVPGFINQVQSPILPPVSLVKTEALAVIKHEFPQSEIMKIDVDDILDSSDIPDRNDIDIVSHTLCEDIKSETVAENILEAKHSESMEQGFVKTENDLYMKIENIIENEYLIKTEDALDENGGWGTGQEVVEDLNVHFNALGNLETDQQLVLKSDETTSQKKDKEKIKINKVPSIPVETHEYTCLANNKHVCNHCQHVFITVQYVKVHIRKMHKNVTRLYQCPYCQFKSKWSIRRHIIQKHKELKNSHWFECRLCDMRFKIKAHITQHMKVHLTPKQMQDKLEPCLVCGNSSTHKNHEKRYCEKCAIVTRKFYESKTRIVDRHLKYQCDKCDYKAYKLQRLNSHKLNHLKPEEIRYFHCHHCSHKSKQKGDLKNHIFRHFSNEDVPFHCYICDFMTLKRDLIIEHFKKHSKHRSKFDETISKFQLETIYKKREIRYFCDNCDYKTHRPDNLKSHKLIHLKPEEIQYFYCYHCSHKAKRKDLLKTHIFRHFKNGDVPFHCYICDFMTLKRDLITEHFKKHPEHHSKCDEMKYKYQLETYAEKSEISTAGMDDRGIKYYCNTCDYATCRYTNLKKHELIHIEPEEIRYFYCYHCSYKSNRKDTLQCHISMHYRKGVVPFHCYICDFVTLQRDVIIEHLKKHSTHHSKCDETICKYQAEIRFSCDQCHYKTFRRSKLNLHKLIHLKPEEIQYFYCHHCSYKSKRKNDLKAHISRHFKNERIKFDCYICSFTTLNRESIIGHIKEHSEVQIKSEINEGS